MFTTDSSNYFGFLDHRIIKITYGVIIEDKFSFSSLRSLAKYVLVKWVGKSLGNIIHLKN